MSEPAAVDLKGYEGTCFGVTCRLAARNRRRASYMIAMSAHDAGFCRRLGDAFKAMRVRRAKWLDVAAICRGREGFIPEETTDAVHP